MSPDLWEALRPLLTEFFEAGRAFERGLASGARFSAAPGLTPSLSTPRWLATTALTTDPARFQFRHGHDAEDGTVAELPEEKFDPAQCEPLVAWHDPADGADYVIDGHHRLAWAERDGANRIPVCFLDAPTAEEAKVFGENLNRQQAPATFAAPGPPPRSGLAWKEETHRWVNPHTGEEYEHAPGGAATSTVHYHGPAAPAEGWRQIATGDDGREWMSEGAYALLSAGSRAGLTLATVADKNGKQVKRWVRQETSQGAEHRPRAGGAEEAIHKALHTPQEISGADVKALVGHMQRIPHERLRQLALAQRHRIGPTKSALVDRLLAHVRAARGSVAFEPLSGPATGTPAATAAAPNARLTSILNDLRSRPAPAVAAAPAAAPPVPSATPAPSPPVGPAGRPAILLPTAAPVLPQNVEIKYAGGAEGKLRARRAISALLGSDILSGVEHHPPELLAAALMGVDGAKVTVEYADDDRRRPEIRFLTRGEGYTATRTLHRDDRGNLVCHNDYFRIDRKPNPQYDPSDPKSRQWINKNAKLKGAEMLANQVRALRALGVKRIETHAARSDSATGNGMNGYATWPRFGYDDSIGESSWRRLPDDLKTLVESNPTDSRVRRSILNLMTTPEGQKWWDQHGTSLFNMKFDLSDGSLSMRTLENYLAKRNNRE